MSLFLTNSGASLVLANGGVPRASGGPLRLSDLTWVGQFRGYPDHNIGSSPQHAFAIRYVSGQRRLLYAKYSSGAGNVGDLIEFACPTPQLAATRGTMPTWTETRRWSNWSTALTVDDYTGVNGQCVSAMWWDESQGALFYTIAPMYGGNQNNIPIISATILTDGEAGGNVSAGNIKGPWFFDNTTSTSTEWKWMFQSLESIPAEHQAGFGGKTMLWSGGYHATIGPGHQNVGWVVTTALPTLTSAPAPLSALYPTEGTDWKHLFNTGNTAGVTPYTMKRPATREWVGESVAVIGSWCLQYDASGASFSQLAEGNALLGDVDDCLYFGSDSHNSSDLLTIYMTSGASGGTRVVELWNGSSWVSASATVHEGSTALSGTTNTFYWTPATLTGTTVNGNNGYWVRLRVTSQASSGGAYLRNQLSNEQDGTTLAGYSSADGLVGSALVNGTTAKGVVTVTYLVEGDQWYGVSPLVVQPTGGGTPSTRSTYLYTDNYSNGYKQDEPNRPYLSCYNLDHLKEMYAGTRNNNNTGTEATYDSLLAYPNLCMDKQVQDSDEYDGTNTTYATTQLWEQYQWCSGIQYDATAQELLLMKGGGFYPDAGCMIYVWSIP